VNSDREEDGVSGGSAMVAAQRILTLATKSLVMMRNVTGGVKNSSDCADAYIFIFPIIPPSPKFLHTAG